MKGMVISDSAVMRKILRGVLNSADLSEVRLLGSRAQNIEKLKSESFDIILMDNCLDAIDIFDLIRQLRAHWNSSLIFVFGAEMSKEFVLETNSAGATGFIIRPFNPPAVTKRIRQALLALRSDLDRPLSLYAD